MGGVKERAKVRFGAFATADYQHKQVNETGGAGSGIHYTFDEKEGAVRTDGPARVAEDSRRPLQSPNDLRRHPEKLVRVRPNSSTKRARRKLPGRRESAG